MKVREFFKAGFGNCLNISNGVIELEVTLDLGPRIISYKLINGSNMLNEIGKVDPIHTEFGDFYCYGGHRFWHAPEVKPRSYIPDNNPISYSILDNKVVFTFFFEVETGIQKSMEITLFNNTKVEINHILENKNMWDIKIAPWALTVVKPGGRLIIPSEPFKSHADELLPARPLVLWQYTKMNDPRYTWGDRFITVRNDESNDTAQKIGLADKQGWAAYEVNNNVFIKKFPYEEGKKYPDNGCNLETFTKGSFHEFETLGYLRKLHTGESCSYIEEWYLFDNIEMNDCEENMSNVLSSLLEKAK